MKFLDTQDSFYEGAYLNQVHFLPASESWYRVWPVWLINNGYLWRVRNNVPAGATVLELGCAGGVAYFARRYTMIGLDLSLASLESASGLYDTLIQADAAKAIPVADESVDAVTSSFFWEHIPPAVKTNILAEVRRILKPGGKLIFLYDVETHNPLMSALRNRSPELYDAEFIERDGHLGYEEPGDNIETFESAGFKVIEQVGLERTPLQSTTVYGKMKKWPKPFSALGGLLHRIESTRAGFFAYIGLLRALDETVGKLLPERWSRMALTVCEKAG
ncbi:MAG TPA: class I SAM-dependent methyltransferase [Gemmatimonadaceae bacterium]|nr:class I SAM-dependent methyltransferase [Gemmatimonadaceae bacterium]